MDKEYCIATIEEEGGELSARGSGVVIPASAAPVSNKGEAVEEVRGVDRLQKALKAVEMWQDKYKEFMRYELSVLNQVDSVATVNSKTGKKSFQTTIDDYNICGRVSVSMKNYLEWWINLSPADRVSVQKEAVESFNSIRGVFRNRRKKANNSLQAAVEKADFERIAAVEEFQDTGRVNLDYFSGLRAKNSVTASVSRAVDAVKDRTKDDLIKHGAVGVGDNWYINPYRFPQDAIPSLNIKAVNIMNSIKSFKKHYEAISKKCGTSQFSKEANKLYKSLVKLPL